MIESLLCLSLNGFFEARGEPLQGQIAVHEVVINRVENPKFPDTICGVVLQENENGVCQFSWWCDLISNIPNEPNSFNTSMNSCSEGLTYPSKNFSANSNCLTSGTLRFCESQREQT